MTNYKHAVAGAAGALFVALAGSVAFAAHSAGAYVCETSTPTKMSPPVTHCITWTHEAAARMAANCDPAMMVDVAMRAQCMALMAGHQGLVSHPAAAG